MNTNVKAVVNLMQTLGVTLDEVKQAMPPAATTSDLAGSIRKAIEDGKVEIKDIFSKKSLALNKLLEYVASDDFPAAVKAEEDDEFPCGEDYVPSTTQPPADKIEYGKTGNGMTYAMYNGKVLGLVLNKDWDGFVLSLYNNGRNVEITQAQKLASSMPAPKGKTWIVPSDVHWRAVASQGFERVNAALRELWGDPLERSSGYLSSTSQANRPARWLVRFVLPIA